jgi:hypothetical protein
MNKKSADRIDEIVNYWKKYVDRPVLPEPKWAMSDTMKYKYGCKHIKRQISGDR